MCVKKSAFKKVILSDFFKNTSLSCFGQPSGERQTHFAFFSPLSPSLFPFVQSNSFVMRQFLFPLYAPAFIRAKNALILSRLTARCWLIRSQFLVSVRKAIALRFIRTSTARSAATASPGNQTNLFFPWFYRTAVIKFYFPLRFYYRFYCRVNFVPYRFPHICHTSDYGNRRNILPRIRDQGKRHCAK